jgi:hypothetical protein
MRRDAAVRYERRVFDDPAAIDAVQWDTLLSRQERPTPFMRHAWLHALHASGSAVPQTGWSPRFLTLSDAAGLAAALPLYAKTHSYGEYVFDWAWADAYRRHGLRYYPKLLGAVPFTPVPGSRLLARDHDARTALAHALATMVQEKALSSAHVLFGDDADRRALQAAGWLVREGVQFHWLQDEARPYADFADFCSRLQRHKRKNIAQERRRVADSGVTFEVIEGRSIDSSLWDFFHRCYTATYGAHGSTPYLTREFFDLTARDLPDLWVLFVASRGGRRIAASLVAADLPRRHAWGRYWGSIEHVPCLHFEACYYRPLQWCIERGIRRFEGGAQGEHKMARGLLPVKTFSAHRLREPRFADAVAEFLAREGEAVALYVDELRERDPFKAS